MTVAELIAHLAVFDPNLPVRFNTGLEGYQDVAGTWVVCLPVDEEDIDVPFIELHCNDLSPPSF